MLRTSELEYELPERLIATTPAEPRDDARLLVCNRRGEILDHVRFRDIGRYLRGGDLLVRNTTSVIPARFKGLREDTGARVQGLFVATPEESKSETGVGVGRDGLLLWHVLLKTRRAKEGKRVVLFDHEGGDSGLRLLLLRQLTSRDASSDGHSAAEPDGGWLVRVEDVHGAVLPLATMAILDRIGWTPLPPYILSARKHAEHGANGAAIVMEEEPAGRSISGVWSDAPSSERVGVRREDPNDDARDRAWYQTVYADPRLTGSVAAPTAGLHFTPALLESLTATGVDTTDVVLHVGLGTFRPVETEYVEQHPMHAEWCRLPGGAASAIAATRSRGGRVIAVGTTAARTLESFPAVGVGSADASRESRLLITPGYRFGNMDGIITNFHLPRSTLLALVAALFEPGDERGIERLRRIYAEAIARGYRFYSYGDAMLVLP